VNKNVYIGKVERSLGRRRAAALMVDTPSRQTRKIYDILAPLYPISSLLLHSNAHRRALAASGITNGMRVLEVAIGSGEMFDRILRINPDGQTLGLDLSPNMAAKTQSAARRKYRNVAAFCQAADARHMPFAGSTFDALVCCYLLELLSDEDIVSTLSEFQRVLKPGGRLTLILIHQNASGFNTAYKFCTRIAPAFWGRQVERRVPNLLRSYGFKIESDHDVRQIFYPSRVIACVNGAEQCRAAAAS
jgi:ubiquinone/menaquinone biosynthesis C-methylase UbiE